VASVFTLTSASPSVYFRTGQSHTLHSVKFSWCLTVCVCVCFCVVFPLQLFSSFLSFFADNIYSIFFFLRRYNF
jgi:hypothetical protein